jgi:hypothetical protein
MNFVDKTIIASINISNTLLCFSCGAKTNPGSAIYNNVTYSGQPARLQGGLFPVWQKPDTLFVIEDNNFSDAELLTAQTLQGVLAQTKPRIYCIRGDSYPLWLKDLTNYYGVKSDYTGGKGSIYWVNGKPVITGRCQLWSGQTDSPESLAQKINSLSTDITSSKGYSLIPVHAWQNTVEDVANCISLLNKNVRVVTPDEFVALIKKNISH